MKQTTELSSTFRISLCSWFILPHYMNDSIKGITFCLTFFPNCLAEQSLKKYEWKLMRNVKLCQFSTCKATAGVTSHTMIGFNETQNVVFF